MKKSTLVLHINIRNMSEESWNILSSTNPEIERNIYAYNSTLLELNCPFSSIPE